MIQIPIFWRVCICIFNLWLVSGVGLAGGLQKCVDGSGNITYSDVSCSGGVSGEQVNVSPSVGLGGLRTGEQRMLNAAADREMRRRARRDAMNRTELPSWSRNRPGQQICTGKKAFHQNAGAAYSNGTLHSTSGTCVTYLAQ